MVVRSTRSFLIRCLLAPLVLTGLLAACATDDNAGFVPVAKTAPVAAAPADDPAAEPEVAALPPLPHLDAKEVLGFSRADLLHAFGLPAFRRIDKGAEILRFRGTDCLLDVFLYKDSEKTPGKKDENGGSGTARVAHFETRDTTGKSTDREACANRTPRERG